MYKATTWMIGLLGSLLLIGGLPGAAVAQTYKVYLQAPKVRTPKTFTVNEIALIPGRTDYFITGDIQGEQTPSFAYLLRMAKDGTPLFSTTLLDDSLQATNGVVSNNLASDTYGFTYLAGSTSASRDGVGEERTLTSISPEGREFWTFKQSGPPFVTVDFRQEDESLVAISKAADDRGYYNFLIQQYFTQSGEITGARVLTKGNDDPAGLVTLPGGKGYFAGGTTEQGGRKFAVAINMDPSLNLNWGYYYEGTGYYVVKDISLDGSGLTMLAGTRYFDQKETTGQPFILAINDEGRVAFHYVFKTSNMEARATAVAGFTRQRGDEESGYLLGGYVYNPRTPNLRQPFVLRGDSEGNIEWAVNYIDEGDQRVEQDEIVKDLMFLPEQDLFIAAGETTISARTGTVGRRIWLARLRVRDGLSGEAFTACANPINFVAGPLDIERRVTGEMGPGLDGVVEHFVTDSLVVRNSYCTISARDEMETPVGQIPQGSLTPRLVTGGGIKSCTVFDIQGRVLAAFTSDRPNAEIQLPTDRLNPGMYLLHIQSPGEPPITEKRMIAP
ncbi:T9SS type A sorting domain-containing protein [Pontibacter sp. G13]|uniref:T9SS type A sorting domain-containing protein n=1 Tax=Pontibacter sp. G13 TaxID=3074898 RepID=UPI002888FC49|nr:T9SS type A sorting domain-containing protein [Pontibacter sp. G13]WNJ17285.1 T9SS type A sorting domain-containing protein [Pontibacter sp. G13]